MEFQRENWRSQTYSITVVGKLGEHGQCYGAEEHSVPVSWDAGLFSDDRQRALHLERMVLVEETEGTFHFMLPVPLNLSFILLFYF